MYIEGNITRHINGRRAEIPFYIDTLTGTYSQWGTTPCYSVRTSNSSKRCVTPPARSPNRYTTRDPASSLHSEGLAGPPFFFRLR